jgi:hypothetical protein
MTETATSTTTAPSQADLLQIATDLIRAHSDLLPRPCVFAYSSGKVKVTWQLMHSDDTRDDQKAAAQQIIRAVGGEWRKKPWDDRFDFEREFCGIKVEIYASREQVCTRRVVGTETVTVPAVEAQPERTEVRELVEWDCTPVLAEAASR